MKVLLTVRGKKSPPMILLPKPWLKRLSSPNQTTPKRRKGVATQTASAFPLIDPWYGTHIHFPVVPSDYLPLPLGPVWLSIYCCDTEVSWAPLAYSIPNLDICQGTSFPVPILLEFGSSTSLGWKEWVDKELSDMGFMVALQQAGMLKAIVSSCCLSNYRDLFQSPSFGLSIV